MVGDSGGSDGQFKSSAFKFFDKGSRINFKNMFLALTILSLMCGCDVIASKASVLSDDQIKFYSAGSMGYLPDNISIVNRRTEGANTYVALRSNDGHRFSCIINEGNILTFRDD